MNQLAQSVALWLAQSKAIKKCLKNEGRHTVDAMAARHGVRGLARMTGLSPTYICEVRRGHKEISPTAYLRIVKECLL